MSDGPLLSVHAVRQNQLSAEPEACEEGSYRAFGSQQIQWGMFWVVFEQCGGLVV